MSLQLASYLDNLYKRIKIKEMRNKTETKKERTQEEKEPGPRKRK